jgi:hypothetical protein
MALDVDRDPGETCVRGSVRHVSILHHALTNATPRWELAGPLGRLTDKDRSGRPHPEEHDT